MRKRGENLPPTVEEMSVVFPYSELANAPGEREDREYLIRAVEESRKKHPPTFLPRIC